MNTHLLMSSEAPECLVADIIMSTHGLFFILQNSLVPFLNVLLQNILVSAHSLGFFVLQLFVELLRLLMWGIISLAHGLFVHLHER